MVLKPEARLRGVVAGAALAAAIGMAITGLAHRFARQVIVGQAEQRLQLAARAAADLLALRLDQVLETLRQLAVAREVSNENPSAGLADLRDRVLPRTLRGIVEADGAGKIRSAIPVGTEVVLPPDVVAAVVRRASASLSAEWAETTEGVTGLEVMLVSILLSGASTAEGGTSTAVVGVIDTAELLRDLSIDPLVSSSGLLVAARAGGELVATAGRSRPTVPSLDVLLPGAELADAREQLASGRALRRRFDANWQGRREEVLTAAEPVAGVPGEWAVAALLPTRAVLDPGRGLFLAGGIGSILLAALAVALVSAWVRAESARRYALAEVDRVHKLGSRSDLEARWRFLVEHAPGVALLLRGSVVVGVNRQAEEFLGSPGGRDLIGRRITDLVDEDQRPTVEQYVAGGSAGRAPGHLRTTLVARDGRRVAVELSAAELGSDDGGSAYRWVAIADLRRLCRAETLLKSVVSSDPRALVLLTAAGEVSWTNLTFCQRAGHTSDDLQGRSPLFLVEPTDRRRARVLFASALRGRTRAAHLRVRSAAGTAELVDVEARPLEVAGTSFGVLMVGQEGKPGTLVGASENDHMSAVVANFGTAVAHRLSNDFQALLGLLERFRQGGGPGADCEAMAALLGNAAAELQQLMAVGRVGSSGLRLLHLGGLVERWAERASARVPGNVRLTVRRDSADDRIMGDALQLGLVLDLVLAGAVAEMERGGGAVEVALVGTPGAETLRLEISDTGESGKGGTAASGVRAGVQLPPRESALAVARAVAQRHGGRCGDRSSPGIGNRIWLDLPLCRERTPHARGTGTPLRHGAVLLADDEEIVRETLAAALRERGHEVVEARDGAMVVELVAADPERFGLVVLDLLMPLMGGREAYQQLREIAPAVAVLVCTGYEPVEDEDLRGAEAIIKPFSIAEFVSRVEEALGPPTAAAVPDGSIQS